MPRAALIFLAPHEGSALSDIPRVGAVVMPYARSART